MRAERVIGLSAAAGLVVICAGLVYAKSGDESPPSESPPSSLDAIKPQLLVLGTPGGQYLALVPELDNRHVYYGDRRTLHRQKVLLTATDEDENFSVLIWAPSQLGGAAVELVDDQWQLRCGTSITKLVSIGAAERELLLKTARFEAPRLGREPYALARNERGEYFYIDRDLSTRGSRGFRFYIGRTGKARPVKLAWVVSDSEGDVFASRAGQLRITASGAGERAIEWRRGAKSERLIEVPITRNPYLIYKELGVYQNHQLGTPCDGRP